MKASFKIIIDNSSGVKQSGAAESEQQPSQSEMLLIESPNDMNEELMEDNRATPDDLTENNEANEQQTVNSDSPKVDELEKQPIAAKEKLYFNKASESDSADTLRNLSEEEVSSLYASLSITAECFEKDDSVPEKLRKEAVHLIGVDDMSTDDIFEFFKGYRPLAVEWINDISCNVIWKEASLASLALFELTQSFDADSNEGKMDTDEEAKEEDEDLNKVLVDGLVKTLKCRKSLAHAKNGSFVFARFARLCDKKVRGAESRSRYYVKHGNPNYGNMTGLISSSKRMKLKGKRVKGEEDSGDEDREVDLTKLTRRNQILSRLDMSKRDENNNDSRNVISKRKMKMYSDDIDDKKEDPSKRLKISISNERSSVRSRLDYSSGSRSGNSREKVDLRVKLNRKQD